MIHDIRLLLEQHKEWQVKFYFREANRAAHSLAKLTYKYVGEKIWMEECLGDVFSIAIKNTLCDLSDI